MSSSSDQEDLFTAFASILKPGSSLHPTFLAVLDGAFLILFLVFVVLAYLTSGNIHLFALMGIELALWASVKWFVNELKSLPVQEQSSQESEGHEARKDI